MTLIVLSGPDILSQNLYSMAKARGLKVVSIYLSGEMASNKYCDQIISVAKWTPEECVLAIEQAALDEIVAFAPIKEALIPLATSLRKHFGPSSGDDFADMAFTDSKFKTKIRERVGADEIFPKWTKAPVTSFASEVSSALKPGSPVVVKPLHGYSGIGVCTIRKNSDILPALDGLKVALKDLESIISGLDADSAREAKDYFVIEEFIESTDFVVDAVLADSSLVFSAFCEKAPRTSEFNEDIGYFTAHQLTDEVMESAREALRRIARTYPKLVTIVHAEFRVQNGKAVLYDIAFRAGGYGLSDLIHYYSMGISLFDIWLGCGMGKNAEVRNPEVKKHVLLYLGQVKAGGKVRTLPSVGAISSDHGGQILLDFSFCEVGDVLSPFPSYSGHTSATIIGINNEVDPRKSTMDVLKVCDRELNPYYIS